MIHNTKTYYLIIITILMQFETPNSKFCTDSPLTQSYLELSRQKYFIDKSLLIKDIFEKYCFSYFYITAPKGFGKTTIANMIHFFAQAELNDTNHRKHFRNTVAYRYFINRKISRSKKLLQKHISRYSVIRLDLRIHIPAHQGTEEVFLKIIKTRIQNCFQEYKWILPKVLKNKWVYFGSKHSKLMVAYIENAMSGRLSSDEAVNGLFILSKLLHLHFRKSVIVIIDNYDYLMERFVRKGRLVRKIYDYIDRLLFETFETGVENVYLGFIFGVSGLPLGETNEVEVPDYVVIGGDEYPGNEERQRMFRWAFLENHVFTPYLGFSDSDLMVLNRKYNSNETEKNIIKRRFDGYMATAGSSFYNLFSVTKYFTDKITNLNSTEMQIKNCRPQFDKSRFIDRFIKRNTIRAKFLTLVLYNEINQVIEKTYEKQVYLHEFFDPKSQTSPNQTNEIFTYLFEQGYLTHSLKPNHVSIPNLEIREYLLKLLRLNYEEMKIDVKQCSEMIENIFEYRGDEPTLLEKELEEIFQKEFTKLMENSGTTKIQEYQAIAYVAAFHTKYRTKGEIMLELRNEESKNAQVLLLDLENRQAMIVEVKESGTDGDEKQISEYNLTNITHIRYLTINVHENGPTVIIQ